MIKKIGRAHLSNFLANHKTEKTTLDIGAGYVDGNHSYDRYFPNRYTVDIDPARKPDKVGDIHDLPIEDESYEVVLCTEVLEHCVDPKQAASELKRVLKPGGKLILTTRFVYPIHDAPHDYWRFTKYGLQEIFKDWTIEELVPETQTFSGVAVQLQRIGYQTKLKMNKVSKVFVFMLSWLLNKLNWLIEEEFGDIKKSTREETIITSGYYLVARKK